jgi:type III secretion protein R
MMCGPLVFSAAVLLASPAALKGSEAVTGAGALATPSLMLVTLAALALLPFVVMMVTSFVKISVVLSIVRNALGTQQIPPSAVVTGLSVVLTMYVMAPVASLVYSEARAAMDAEAGGVALDSVDDVLKAFDGGKEPLRRFLRDNSGSRECGTLQRIAAERWNGTEVRADDFSVLVPAFVLTQLREGFRIGFCIYIPFLVVDLIVVNMLMALGMSMLPPSVVSIPLKLLVFISADGWAMISTGLVESFK